MIKQKDSELQEEKNIIPRQSSRIHTSQGCTDHSRIDHMSSHETSLSKFEKIEIIPSIFSNHDGMKLEVNFIRKLKKKKKTRKNLGD